MSNLSISNSSFYSSSNYITVNPRVCADTKCSTEFLHLEFKTGRQEEVDATEKAFQSIVDTTDAAIQKLVRQHENFQSIPIPVGILFGRASTSWGKSFIALPSFKNAKRFLHIYHSKNIFDENKSTITFYVLPPSVHILARQPGFDACQDTRHTHVFLEDGQIQDRPVTRRNLETGSLENITIPSEFKQRYSDVMYNMSIKKFLIHDFGDKEEKKLASLQISEIESQFVLSIITFHFRFAILSYVN